MVANMLINRFVTHPQGHKALYLSYSVSVFRSRLVVQSSSVVDSDFSSGLGIL